MDQTFMQWRPGVSVDMLERWTIENAMAFFKGVKSKAAASCGINVRTLEMKLEKYAREQKEHVEREKQLKLDRDNFILRSRGMHPDQRPRHPLDKPSAVPAAAGPASAEPGDRGSPVGEPVSVPEPQEVPGLLSAKSTSLSSRKRSGSA